MMHIIFCRTNQKNVLQKEIKDRTFEVYLSNEEPSQFLIPIPSDWITKNDLCQFLPCFLNFLSNQEQFGLFFAA